MRRDEFLSYALAAASLTATPLQASATANSGSERADRHNKIRAVVDPAIRSLMKEHGIAGLALGIVTEGQSYAFNYGVASTQSQKPVTHETLFELGSLSKTLVATLTSYAEVSGHLSLSDKTSKYLRSVRGSKFGDVSLLDLGTHTPGGLPLQAPRNIRNDAQLMRYFRAWQPTYAPGTYRTYSNLSVAALALATAKSMGADFTALMERRLFPALGMTATFIDVPEGRMADYAQGYTKDDVPRRVAPGVLAREAYGVKTTATDMLRFVEANLGLIKLDPQIERAITNTHTGYFQAGPMTQDLLWEQYPYPVALRALLKGNSPAMIFNATPVNAIKPLQEPRKDAWINKTGSTDGFRAYAAFIPEKALGVVLLANKNYPLEESVTAAYRILTPLANGAR